MAPGWVSEKIKRERPLRGGDRQKEATRGQRDSVTFNGHQAGGQDTAE